MSNNVRLQELLKAVDRASRPLNAIQNASLSLAASIRDSEAALRALDEQAGRINGFRKANEQLAVTGQSLARAKQQTAELALQLKNTQNPTRDQADALAAARQSAAALKLEYNNLRQSVQRQRGELAQAGINTRTLSSDERRLKQGISEKTLQLNRHKEALARVNQQQERLNTVQNRYESGKRVAAGVQQFANASAGMAKAGFNQTSRFIAPGIRFEKQMSAIQASLGLQRGIPGWRPFASRHGMSASVQEPLQMWSPGRRASWPDQAMTPYGVWPPLCRRLTSASQGILMPQSVDIIRSTQASFNLANTDVERVADVLTRGFTASNTSLTELSTAVASAAPAAGEAGASLEETTALLGILMEKGMKGADAGAEVSAMLSRLQAPDGQRSAALNELKVQTRDGEGNPLPTENILKAISTSFENSKIGAAQQTEYLKAIFGADAMQGAGGTGSAAWEWSAG